jgi:hypothetical protein
MTNLDAGLIRLLLGVAVLERAEMAKRKARNALTLAAIGLGITAATAITAMLSLGQLATFLLELQWGRATALTLTTAGFAILAVGFGYWAWTRLMGVFGARVAGPLAGAKATEEGQDPLWNLAGALAVGIVAGATRGRGD